MANQIPNTTTRPYFDDFSEDKKFLRVLFRPGYSVQARELTQLQSILQNQVERFGRHMFKDGSMIIPGGIAFDLEQNFAKVLDVNSDQEIIRSEWFLNSTVRCITAGNLAQVEAKIVDYVVAENSDPTTLYFKYLNQGEDVGSNILTKFLPDDELEIVDSPNSDYIGKKVTIQSASDSVGTGSCASIGEGVYFVRGFFVKVSSQKIFLEKYGAQPVSYRVGLDINETIVTEKDDSSLLSNASGTPNYAAPGAHRLKISLDLIKIIVEEDEEPRQSVAVDGFVELLVIKDNILYKQVRYTEYNILEETLARRTYDESGDYTVRPFLVTAKDYLDNGENNGLYKKSLYLENFSYPYEIQKGDILKQTVNQQNVSGSADLFNSTNNRVYFVQTSIADFDVAGSVITFYDSDGNQQFDPQQNAITATLSSVTGNDYDLFVALSIDPGKAYVRGHEIEKIAKEVIKIDKARAFRSNDNVNVAITHGNCVYVKNIVGVPAINEFQMCDIYNVPLSEIAQQYAEKIGSCRLKFFHYESGTPGLNSDASDPHDTNNYAKYFLHVSDVDLLEGKDFENAKSFYTSAASTSFKCDIICDLWKSEGRISISGSNITGAGTRFLRDLKVNDRIVVRPNSLVDRTILLISANPSDDFHVTCSVLSGPLTAFSQEDFFVEFATVDAPINDLLIYKAPHGNLKRLNRYDSLNPDEVDITFSVYRKYQLTAAGSQGDYYLEINLTGQNETLSYNPDDYILYNENEQAIIEPESVEPVIQGDWSHVKVHVVNHSGIYQILCIINKSTLSAAGYKKKYIQSSYILDITDQSVLKRDVIALNQLDAFEIEHIWMNKSFGDGFNTPEDLVDVASRYTLDTGQRDNYYDYAAIIRKQNTPIPTGDLRIVYSYFSHESPHGFKDCYYAVNSYVNAYEQIPSYVSSNGTLFQLRDCIDFRPDVTQLDLSQSQIELPVPIMGFITDYEYYLNRRDLLVLDAKGNFNIVEGVSDINPVDPEASADSMILYKVFVPAYTYNSSDLDLTFVDNKRYTMRDIGKLERRIENLEYYTTLSLLEKETADMNFRDPDSGLDRFKLGFIVDPFTGQTANQGVGDIVSKDYRCAIDTKETQLRPQFNQELCQLIIDPETPPVHLTEKGDLILLNYEEVPFIVQEYATYFENVNPFNVFTHIGTLKLDPPQDEWKETKVIDANRVNVEGDYNSLDQLSKQMGTVWNDWQTSWSGWSEPQKQLVSREQIGWELKNNEEVYYNELHYDTHGKPIKEKLNKKNAKQIKELREEVKESHPKRRIIESRWAETKTGTLTTLKKGVRFEVRESTLDYDMGEKVVSVDYVPFIRSRVLRFDAKRLLPNTVVFPFFDGKAVANFCGTSLQSDLAGINHVVASSLKTNERGELSGYFEIPNISSLQFATGERKFKLTDLVDNTGASKTRCQATYRAQGLLETKQKTIMSVRNAELVSVPVEESDVVTLTDTNDFTKTIRGDWIDPIAQTFRVDSVGGAFITSVDVFFKSASSSIPVELQIREITGDQRPDPNKIIPFARCVLTPGVDTINVSDDALLATKFTFESPVYLMDKTVYAVCIISDSNDYEVFIADKTPPSPDTPDDEVRNKILTPQIDKSTGQSIVGLPLLSEPYEGVFFKSQNAGTWTDDQMIDLKFTIYKAKFTENSGSFVAIDISDLTEYWTSLSQNAFRIKSGSNLLRVFHPNHGFRTGDTVSIVFSADTPLRYDDGSIPDLRNRQIDFPELDYYIIAGDRPFQMLDKPDYSGHITGSSIQATRNKKYDTLRPIIGELNFIDTYTSYSIETTQWNDINKDLLNQVDLLPNENISFGNSMVIYSPDNRNQNPPGNKSVRLTVRLNTENENVSPVIDVKRLSAILIANRLDSPSQSINWLGDLIVDQIIAIPSSDTCHAQFNQSDSSIVISKTPVPLTEAKAREYYDKFYSGKYIKVSNSNPQWPNFQEFLLKSKILNVSSPTDATLKFYVDLPGIVTESVDNCNIILYDHFVDEIAPMSGSAAAKYVTRRMSLANYASALKILFPAYRHESSEIDVYFKILAIGDNRDMDEIEYVKAIPDTEPRASMSDTDIINYSYTIDNRSFYQNTDILKYPDLKQFTAVACKIVMRGTNSAKPPRILDFRMIALDN